MDKPTNLNLIVKERVQAAIGDILTEEQWEELIETEWKNLMEKRLDEQSYSWGSPKYLPPVIKNIIANEMYRQLKEKAIELVAKYIAQAWNINFQVFDSLGNPIPVESSLENLADLAAKETVINMTAIISRQVASSLNFKMSQEVVSQLQMLYEELKRSGRL